MSMHIYTVRGAVPVLDLGDCVAAKRTINPMPSDVYVRRYGEFLASIPL